MSESLDFCNIAQEADINVLQEMAATVSWDCYHIIKAHSLQNKHFSKLIVKKMQYVDLEVCVVEQWIFSHHTQTKSLRY